MMHSGRKMFFVFPLILSFFWKKRGMNSCRQLDSHAGTKKEFRSVVAAGDLSIGGAWTRAAAALFYNYTPLNKRKQWSETATSASSLDSSVWILCVPRIWEKVETYILCLPPQYTYVQKTRSLLDLLTVTFCYNLKKFSFFSSGKTMSGLGLYAK